MADDQHRDRPIGCAFFGFARESDGQHGHIYATEPHLRRQSAVDQRSINEWYDVACFVNPALYTFGNTGRNVLIGPGLFSWDLGADKDFRLNEQLGLQFRLEFFNILNRPNFGLPSGSIGSAAAGTITTVLTSGRQIQFALRLHW